jgi:hypothetical protein
MYRAGIRDNLHHTSSYKYTDPIQNTHACVGMMYFYAFLNLPKVGDEWSASRPSRLTSRQESPVLKEAGLAPKISCPYQEGHYDGPAVG